MSFTASPIVSPFPDQNALFDPAKAIETGQTIQKNQLGLQGAQLDLTAADHEQVGRLAAGLLNIQDPTARAQAYAQGVGVLQSQGLAKYAPPTLPDEGSLRMLVSQSIPAADQYKMGLGQQAAQGAITALSPGGAPTTGAAPGSTTGTAAPSSVPIPARGTGGPGASASAPTAWLPYFAEASKETGIPVDLLLAQARQESSFNPNNVGKSGEIGLFQIMPSTARSPGPGMQGVDPATLTGADNVRNNIMFGARYLKAQMGGGDPNNPAVQAAALRRYNGTGPGGDPNYVQHVFGYRPTLAPSDPNAAITAYTPPTAGATTASAAPATAQPGQPVPTQVASNTPMVSTAPPGSTAAPGGPVQPAATSPAPAQPGQPQGPAATAQAPPTPASVQPTAAPPAVPHLVTPNGQQVPPPPGGVAVLSNGLTPQQWGLVQNELRAASAGGPAAIAAVLEKVPQLAQQNTALNMAAWKAAHPELGKIETAQGSILYNPNTGETVGTIAHAPVPTTPRFTSSSAVWNPTTSQYEPVTPANANLGTPVQGHWGVNNTGNSTFYADSPAAIQRQEEAKTSGAAAGTASVQLYNGIIARAQAAQKSEGDIDYASNQLAQAAKGGQTTGFFSPAMATAAAVAKSLGLTDAMRAVGVDPSTVGNIQSAQKTLAVLGASILQQALGKDSQITDAKIQAYEHTQPGIENDPQALQRIMAWARSQFTYERELGHAAAVEAGNNGGILPPTFLPRYYANVGFAPVYDSVSGEMRQPDGRQPERETPATLTTAPINPAASARPRALSTARPRDR